MAYVFSRPKLNVGIGKGGDTDDEIIIARKQEQAHGSVTLETIPTRKQEQRVAQKINPTQQQEQAHGSVAPEIIPT